MGKSKKETDLKEAAELTNHFKTISNEQLVNMKYSPRGYLHQVFKRALNQELKSRGLSQK